MRKALLLLILAWSLPLAVMAQLTRRSDGSYRFEPLLDRLYKFAMIIPQEKVYIHMDNTCYFQGDTIWFAAYLVKTSTDKPSDVSGVLYVELLNNEGYLVERKLIEMQNGRGHGFFALDNQIQYSGYYELRAYTRWQLNWGLYEHKHSRVAHNWFYGRKEDEKLFFRDYEKLYSRVFPVYDRPAEPGGFEHDITSRIMRRTFKKDIDEAERKPTLTLYPEGGNLVAGVENRVAFEAVMNDGEWLEGTAPHPSLPEAEEIKTVSRGRGVFTIVPEAGKTYEVKFTTKDGLTVKAKLPKAEEQGVALAVRQEGDSIYIKTHPIGLAPDTLALTVMHEGRVDEFKMLKGNEVLRINNEKLKCGVNQVTVFDAQGRVYADRLFFVTKRKDMQPTLTIQGIRDDYLPYDSIGFDIQGRAKNAEISLSVYDALLHDELFDNANILTEMLLSSEIRGFVPAPGWFFEKDDEEHRQALDLLMMTQGWRRFNWRDMAVEGQWELTQPDERSPIIIGRAKVKKAGSIVEEVEGIKEDQNRFSEALWAEVDNDKKESNKKQDSELDVETLARIQERLEQMPAKEEAANEDGQEKILTGKKSTEVLVHAELTATGSLTLPVVGEAMTKNHRFHIQLPPFYGKTIFFLAASDSTKWKGKQYTWTQMLPNNEELVGKARRSLWVDDAECSVKVDWPYPRFVKPYNFYQEHLSESGDTLTMQGITLSDGTRQLREVAVRARRNGMWRFDDSQPAMILDYYESLNISMDAGLPLVRALCSDYGSDFPYIRSLTEPPEPHDRIYEVYGPSPQERLDPPYCDIPLDSIYSPKYLKALGLRKAPHEKIVRLQFDRVLLYTDYCPRLEGSRRYKGSNLPETRLAYYPYYDGSYRVIYRDRRYILDGYAYPAEFYNPDYSKQKPQEPTDYRRTLYWNPSVKLDAWGRARVTLYNNSRSARISVSAAGQAQNGTLLWNK